MMNLEKRIEKLERSNRRLKWGVGLLIGTIAGALIMGQDQPAQVTLPENESGARVDLPPDKIAEAIHARRIVVVGSNGREIITLGESQGGGGMVATQNKLGHPIVQLGMTTNGEGNITTFNDRQKEIIKLSATTAGEGMLTTFNGKGRRLVGIGATTEGKPLIYTYEPDGDLKATWP